MLKLKIDLSGKDSTFLSNCHRYYSGLQNLDLYRNPPDKVPSLERCKVAIDLFEQAYGGAVNGDRVQISKRNKARKDVCEIFEKALHYLQSVAEDDDTPALLQAGFEVRRASRKRTVIAPAAG